MVWVFVDDDLIGVPEPAVTEGEVGCSYIPIPAVEPEAGRAATSEMPYVRAAEATGEVAMGERLIDVIAGVTRTGVVTDPGFSIVNVRSVRVAGLVNVIALGLRGILDSGGSRRRLMDGRGTTRGIGGCPPRCCAKAGTERTSKASEVSWMFFIRILLVMSGRERFNLGERRNIHNYPSRNTEVGSSFV